MTASRPVSRIMRSHLGLLTAAAILAVLASLLTPELSADNAVEKIRVIEHHVEPALISPGVLDGRNDRVHASLTLAIKRTDALGSLDRRSRLSDEKVVLIRWVWEIADSSGVQVASLAQDEPLTPTLDGLQFPGRGESSGSPYIEVVVQNEWDGKDNSGAFVPDGEYGYRITAELIRVNTLGNGRSQEKIIDEITPQTGSLRIDNTPPVVTAVVTPNPNENDWNNGPVTIAYECMDEIGVESCPADMPVSGDCVNQTFPATAFDLAGNATTINVLVKIDTLPPAVEAVLDPPANANGWNTDDVLVSFDAIDECSGIAAVTAPVPVSGEGTGQEVPGEATDLAGNSTRTIGIVNLDRTPPVFDQFEPAMCPVILMDLRARVLACFSDTLSGMDEGSIRLAVDSVDITSAAVLSGNCIGWIPAHDYTPGQHEAMITGTDLAGNPSSEAWCFEVAPASPVLDVEISSPSDGLLTNAHFLDVTGAVTNVAGSLSRVTVNGVPAVISGVGFTASGVALIEGVNHLTATAEDTTGRLGTATVTLTRDTAPPRFTITAPREDGLLAGLVSDVAGEINDTVVGTVDSRDVSVSINGVPAAVANRGFRAMDVAAMDFDPTTRTAFFEAVASDTAGNQSALRISVRIADPASKRILEIAGNNQMGQVGEILMDSLVVELRNEFDALVPGETVVFRVSRGDGALNAGERSVAVTTDAAGRASSAYTLGGRVGIGNNRVEASAVGFAGRVYFTADATPALPDKIAIVSGNNQVGVVGKKLPEPLTIIVSDDRHNCVENTPVTFQVTEGGGHFGAGSQTVTVLTDKNGWASASLVLGPMEGNENNVVEATFPGLVKLAARFSASGRDQGPAADTRIVGIVLDNTDAPIPGATVSIKGTPLATVSDVEGRFAIPGAPVGALHLHVDGSTTSREGDWPSLEYAMVTVSGRDNDLGRPVYLPQLTTEVAAVTESQGGICTISSVPGFRLEVEPGSATFGDGTKTGIVSVTQVHPDKVPMTPPMGMAPPIVVSIMPADVHFDPPARMIIPNFEGLKPGETSEMFSFDHDLGMFITIGTATVTEDGAFLISDPGQGIIKGGWHCGGPPSGGRTNIRRCDDMNICTSDFCNRTTGACIHQPLTGPTGCDPGVLNECVRSRCVAGTCRLEPIVQCPYQPDPTGPYCSVPDSAMPLLPDPSSPDEPSGACPFSFSPPCREHDACYRKCHDNDRTTRSNCDDAFCDDLLGVCEQFTGPAQAGCRRVCRNLAITYCDLVKLGGGSAFADGQRISCKCCGN